MTAQFILTEKLRRPEAVGLGRSRLEKPLLDSVHRDLDLIVAPAGSGKTTLLARVAAATPLPVAWYRVTGDDADAGAFIAHLTRSLGGALGGAIAELPPTTHDVTELLSALDGVGQPAMVVLDDLHEISGSPAERVLEVFLALRPRSLRVIIGTRRPPGINVSRLRVSGLLREITGDDLRFRSWEVEELFVAVFGEPLSPESAAALTRQTGGWAAALQLFHLATSGRTAAERLQAVADLGGRSRLIRSYLTRNVLAELTGEHRRFLVRTCTLGTVTGELCDALLQTTGSAAILDELEQRQLFTSSDDDGRTFRYHEVLRAHLELALVEEYGAAGAREWYRRSADLLEQAGELRSAIRAYARAEDWPAVARLIRLQDPSAGSDLLLPASMLATDPWLALVEARRRVRSGAVASAVEAFRLAESLLDEPEFRERCRQERSLTLVWMTSAPAGSNTGPLPIAQQRALSAEGPVHWTVMVRRATRWVPDDLPPTPPTRGAPGPRLGNGVAALLGGNLPWARTALATVAADPATDSTGRLVARLGTTMVDLLRADRADRADSADPASVLGTIVAEAEQDGLAWIGRLARGLQEAALVAVGGPSWRSEACENLPADCEELGDEWGAALIRLACSVAAQLAGDPAAAAGYADAARRFGELDAPVPQLWARALLALHRSAAGAPVSVEAAGIARDADRRGARGPLAVALAAAALGDASGRSGDAALADHVAGSLGLRSAIAALLESGRRPVDATVPPGRPEQPAGAHPVAAEDPFAAAHAIAAEPPTAPEQPTAPTAPTLPTPAAPPGPGWLRVHCLGGFRIEVHGQPVDLGGLRPRSRALLRLLALTPGQDVHREKLIDTLWPEADLVAGTRRLQVAVSSIRHLLDSSGLPGGELIRRQGEAYRLSLPPGGESDVLAFDADLRDAREAGRRGDVAGAVAARESALNRYRGELLPEDGAAEQVLALRERLRLAAAETAAGLADDLRRTGHLPEALAAARRAVQLDPFQDRPWELLAQLHESAGDRTAATRSRQQHARMVATLDGPDQDAW